MNYEKEFNLDAKAFSIPFETWYSESVKLTYKYPYIMIGFYYENDGTEGEFRIEWNQYGIELHAYNDSWEALYRMPELLQLMAEVDKKEIKPTIKEFAIMLKNIGYKDITERKIK